MLIWVCALHCEAKPLIDSYRLKKLGHPNTFDCYQNADVSCIVSGMGSINMAAATAWSASHFSDNGSSAWINLGIAGHQYLDIGTTILASQVRQVDQDACIYPVPLPRILMTRMPVESQQKENYQYSDKFVYDQEAFAFLKTASRFSPLELCQSIKVISDNDHTPPTRNKNQISELIAEAIPGIKSFADALLEIRQQHAQQELAVDSLQRFLHLAHFSQTQQIQLKKTLLALQAFDPSLEKSHQSVSAIKQARQILDTLQNDLYHFSEHL